MIKFNNVDELLDAEIKQCIRFFKDFSNLEEASKGYGLVVDRSNNLKRCSIASVGYMFSVLVIAVELGEVEYEAAKEHTKKTLITLRDNVEHYKGFFAHFVDMETGELQDNCEYSTIDTALCLEGIITVSSFFNDEVITKLANTIIFRVDYEDMVFTYENGKKLLHMSYNPKRGGQYTANSDENGYIWRWGSFSEQIMMYIHMAFKDDANIELIKELYDSFERPTTEYDGKKLVYTNGGAFFIYQFMNAWFDYRKYTDKNGLDIFENAKLALKAHVDYCASGEIDTLSRENWGPNAGDTPDGYRVYGAGPFADHMHDDMKKFFNGTTQQYSILGSLPFDDKLVKKTIWNVYTKYPESFGEYGFSDGMNLNQEPAWFCLNYLGLDKGISAIMLDNHINGTVWKYYMESPLIKEAINKLGYIAK